jgi:hypothetical protein
LQVLESDDAAGVVCGHCGTAQTLAQHTVTGAEGGGVVGCVEDCALCLQRWEVRWCVLRLVMLVRGGRGWNTSMSLRASVLGTAMLRCVVATAAIYRNPRLWCW